MQQHAIAETDIYYDMRMPVPWPEHPAKHGATWCEMCAPKFQIGTICLLIIIIAVQMQQIDGQIPVCEIVRADSLDAGNIWPVCESLLIHLQIGDLVDIPLAWPIPIYSEQLGMRCRMHQMMYHAAYMGASLNYYPIGRHGPGKIADLAPDEIHIS